MCNSSKLHLVLDLGHQPLCDTLLTKDMLHQPELTYPLRMMWCQACTGVGLDYCVDGRVVYYPDYPYVSGISKPLADYQRNICEILRKQYQLKAGDLAIDIGSGDGTLLLGFQKQGMNTVGVEPTNIANIANARGIRTIQSFFDIAQAKKIKTKYGKAKVITMTNVFAHMQTIGEVMMGVYHLLDDNGIFIAETHYLLDVIEGGQFDTIYHEHLRTYSLRSLIKLFEPYDMTITDVERGSRYGGNIRIHVSRGRHKPINLHVSQLLNHEKKAGLDRLETYIQFAKRVQKSRIECMNYLIKAKKSGVKVVGKSCPGRASTLLNFYGVDTTLIPYLAELPTSRKLGMYLPGKHIPVVNEKILWKEQPDVIVLLAWHYADFIIHRLKSQGIRSDFVIPLPKLTMVKNSDVT